MKRKAARLYIDGKWVDKAEVVEIRSPYDQSVVGRHHRAGPEQVEQALAAAERAFREHRNDPASGRSSVLASMARIVERRKEEFARTISAEAGKPIRYARAEVERALHTIRCSAEEAVRIGGELLPLDAVPVGNHHLGITSTTITSVTAIASRARPSDGPESVSVSTQVRGITASTRRNVIVVPSAG